MAGRSYAVFRTQKLPTMQEVGAAGKHIERTRPTRNADPERLLDNERLAGSGDLLADVQGRLDTLDKIRANAIRAVEYVLGVSKEWFDAARDDEIAAWRDASMAWLRQTHGAENVVAAVFHKDELTPHIQAVVVPIDERGKLCASTYLDGPAKLSHLQDRYHAAVADLGIERGVKGSVAEHQTVREYYAKIQQPTPAPEIVRRDLEVERPNRIIGNPERWASEQTERIAERITPALDAALVKAAHYEEQAATAEANVAVLQQRVREVERERDTLQRDYKALVAQARQLDLRDTIQTLGGAQDRYDTHKWRVNDEHISINGERFYNHDRREGGGGSIDLVMHVGGYTFRQAVAYLGADKPPMSRERAIKWI